MAVRAELPVGSRLPFGSGRLRGHSRAGRLRVFGLWLGCPGQGQEFVEHASEKCGRREAHVGVDVAVELTADQLSDWARVGRAPRE